MILYLISLVIVGLLVGALARFLHPGKDDMSIPMTIALGAGSMLVGGLILRPLIGIGGGFITSVLLGVAILFAYERFITNKGSHS